MKILAVAALVFCVVGVQVFALTKEEVDAKMNECHQQTGVNKEQVKKALEGDIKNDPRVKKDIECFFNKMEILNGNEIDKNKLEELLKVAKPDKSDQEIQQLVDKCANQPGQNPRAKAFNVFKCTQGQ